MKFPLKCLQTTFESCDDTFCPILTTMAQCNHMALTSACLDILEIRVMEFAVGSLGERYLTLRRRC